MTLIARLTLTCLFGFYVIFKMKKDIGEHLPGNVFEVCKEDTTSTKTSSKISSCKEELDH